MPHGDTVIHADGIKLKGHPSRLAYSLLDASPKFLEMDVTWNDVDVAVADRDERFGHVIVRYSSGLEK
jgi:hypothetical protein